MNAFNTDSGSRHGVLPLWFAIPLFVCLAAVLVYVVLGAWLPTVRLPRVRRGPERKR